MGKVGEGTRRPPMFVGLAEQIKLQCSDIIKITIPFDLELAKKINNGERNGMIVTDGDNYRVEFVYHREESFPILGVIHTDHGIISDWFSNNGFGGKNYRLKLKVPQYTTFKDGDV